MNQMKIALVVVFPVHFRVRVRLIIIEEAQVLLGCPFCTLQVTVTSIFRMADRDVSLNMTWSEWALLLRGKKLVKQIQDKDI